MDPHSLTYMHNTLTNDSDHFSTGVNKSGKVPPFGEQFTETTAYTSLVPIAASSILVVYGKNVAGMRGGTTFAMQVDFKNKEEVEEKKEDEEDEDDTDYIQGLLDRCVTTNGQALIPAGHYTVARPPVCYSRGLTPSSLGCRRQQPHVVRQPVAQVVAVVAAREPAQLHRQQH